MKDLFGVFENRTRASKLDIKQLHQNEEKRHWTGKEKEKEKENAARVKINKYTTKNETNVW